MTRRRWVFFVAAIALMVIAWFQVMSAREGLVVRSFTRESVPLTYLAPEGAQRSAPGVLIAHGFTGSKQLMLGYGYTLAHSGYAVMLFDLDGHGSNSYPFQRSDLEDNLQTAWDALKEQPEWDAKRLTSLGHSLGSYATLTTAVKNPASFAATVAVAPVPAPVTFRFPRNLQVQVGAWESEQIKLNAGQIMRAAGSESNIPTVDRRNPINDSPVGALLGDARAEITRAAAIQTDQLALEEALVQGVARQRLDLPGVEHIAILFSDRSHENAISWFDRTFGLEAKSETGVNPESEAGLEAGSETEQPYRDRRLVWFAVHWLSGLVALVAIAPTLSLAQPDRLAIPPWRKLLGLALAPVVAALSLQRMNEFIEIQTLGGIQVGSAIALWLLIAGAVWLAFQGRLPKPQGASLARGGVIFVGLWFAFGAMAHVTWMPWLLIPARIPLWPLFTLACFPWFMAAGISQHQGGRLNRLFWWFCQSFVLVAGFSYLAYSIAEIGFVVLLLPFFPILMGMFNLIDSAYRDPWSYGMGCSLFFSWLLAALFPLA